MLAGAGAFVQGMPHGKRPAQQVMTAPSGAELPPAGKVPVGGAEPAPFTYDARTNRHWDPDHHHWHFGPPPSAAARAARGLAPAPEGPRITEVASLRSAARDSSGPSSRARQ